MTSYVVVNECMLGYINDIQPNTFGVLGSSVSRGGNDPKNGPVKLSKEDKVRPAGIRDFDAYRIQVPPDFSKPIIVQETLFVDGKWTVRAVSIPPSAIAAMKEAYRGATLTLKQRFSDGSVVRRDLSTGREI